MFEENDPWAQFLEDTETQDPWAQFLDDTPLNNQTERALVGPNPLDFADEPNAIPQEVPEESERQERNQRNWTWDPMSQRLLGRGMGNLIGGATNAPANLIEYGLSAKDKISDFAGVSSDSAESFRDWVDENLVTYRPPEFREGIDLDEGTVALQDAFMTGIGEMAVGAGPAAKAAGTILKGVRSNIGRRTGKAVAIETGAVGAADPETESLTNLAEYLGLDSDGSYSDEVFINKMNLLGEALVLGGILSQTGNAVSKAKAAWEWISSPIKKLGNVNELEKSATMEIATTLGDLQVTDDISAQTSKIQQLRDRISNFANETFDPNIEGVSPVNLQRDTLSAFEAGATDPTEVSRARGLRSGIEGRGSSNLATALDEPSRQTERLLSDISTAQGGAEAITSTRQNIQQKITDQIDTYRSELQRADQTLLNTKQGVEQILSEDPLLLERLGANINLDTSASRFQAGKSLIDEAMEISEEMTKKKNDLFDAMPSGVPYNRDDLETAIEIIGEELVDLPQDLVNKAMSSKDFKELYDFANIDIGREMRAARDRGEFQTTVPALKALRKHIEETQMEFIAENGSATAKQIAEKAMDNYKNVYAPAWRDGVLEDIQNTFRDNFLQPINRTERTLSTLEGALNNPDRRMSSKQVADLFKNNRGDANKLVDYYKLKAAEEISPIIQRDGKISEEALDRTMAPLRNIMPGLRSADEAAANSLDQYMTRLRDKKFSRKEAEENLKSLQKSVGEEIENLREGPLGRFFSDAEMSSPRETNKVFSDIFKEEDAVSQVRVLARDPENVKGLQTAFVSELENKIFKRGFGDEGLSGAKSMAPVTRDELESLFQVGRELYKDNPKAMEAIEGLTIQALETGAGPSAKLPVFDFGGVRKEASGVVDTAITMIWGPLNRWGARIRSGAGKALGALDPKDDIRMIVDRIAADPKEFDRLMSDIQRDLASKSKKMSPQTRAQIGRWLEKGGMLASQDRKQFVSSAFDPDVDEQTEEALK